MRWFWRLLGLALICFGCYLIYALGASTFLSGWGIFALGFGLVILLCTSWSGVGFAFAVVVGVAITAIARLVLGTGDWWMWLLLAFGIFVYVLIAAVALSASEPTSGDAIGDPFAGSTTRDGASATASARSDRPLTPPAPTGTQRVVASLTPRIPRPRSKLSPRTCQACGAATRATSSFCGSCGAPLQEVLPGAGS